MGKIILETILFSLFHFSFHETQIPQVLLKASITKEGPLKTKSIACSISINYTLKESVMIKHFSLFWFSFSSKNLLILQRSCSVGLDICMLYCNFKLLTHHQLSFSTKTFFVEKSSSMWLNTTIYHGLEQTAVLSINFTWWMPTHIDYTTHIM